jgi:hypothetical protein
MRPVPGLTVGLMLLALCGCNPRAERLNAPPQGHSDYPYEEMQPMYMHMVDNAMLEDMAVADCHFVGQTAELNGAGARRVGRYAQLLAVYGGTLRLDSNSQDEPLVQARIKSIVDYLATAGIERDRIDVVAGLPAGRGILATEAIQVRQKGQLGQKGDEGLSDIIGQMMGGK